MKKEEVIRKVKALPVISRPENTWVGTKHQPYTMELVELKKVLEILNVKERNSKSVYQYTKDNKLVKEYDSIVQAVLETGINRTSISNCCWNKQTSAGGFIWKFVIPPKLNKIKIL